MLALIPLDNRPCNVRFPRQIAAIGGSELLTPPDAILGYFSTPGRPEELIHWLHNVPPVEALLVSIDMLAYGGLVASRRPLVSQETALARLQVLRQFRAARPQTAIYAFNILMRLSITADTDEAVIHYSNVMRYAKLADEAERFNSAYLREQLQQVTEQIPPHVLQDYLAARARNHTINLRMIDWLAEGIFDHLLITQEDCSEFGLHRREQDALQQKAREHDVAVRWSLHPGADEAALTLLARHWNTGVRFRVHWSNPEDARRIAPFEDRPYNRALAEHIASMCGELVAEVNEVPGASAFSDATGDAAVDFELFVNAPVGGFQKDEGEAERGLRTARLRAFVRAMEQAIESGQHVALCDVAFPNGGDNVVMAELEKRKLLSQLAVYGGWNTAGNTTGTVLAQCAALKRSGNFQSAANRQFLFERLVDDWFYQAHVRTRIEKAAREQGVSPVNLGEDYGPVEAQTRRELRGFAQLLAQRHFGVGLSRCDVSLPWRRSFETDVRVE
ncbi:MAG: DUF4127 family protein, partial [Armatimonadota bacterium]|nr:DUF4127 family protein [Armatimonadota bacterium]